LVLQQILFRFVRLSGKEVNFYSGQPVLMKKISLLNIKTAVGYHPSSRTWIRFGIKPLLFLVFLVICFYSRIRSLA
jgi:hypothetical protein